MCQRKWIPKHKTESISCEIWCFRVYIVYMLDFRAVYSDLDCALYVIVGDSKDCSCTILKPLVTPPMQRLSFYSPCVLYMRWSHPFQITSSIPEPSPILVHQHRLLPRPRSVGNKSARYDPWWPPSVEARRVLVKHQRWPYRWSPPLGSPRP